MDFQKILDNSKKFFITLGKEIKENILSKWIGSFVSLAACVLTLVLAIVYGKASVDIYNGSVIAYAVCGFLLFLILSLFRQTSQIAAVLLMVFNVLCLVGFATSEGLIDYFSTQFFDGISVGKFFGLPTADWLSVLLIILTIIISSVGMYLPQNRKTEVELTDASVEDVILGKTQTSETVTAEASNTFEVEVAEEKGGK